MKDRVSKQCEPGDRYLALTSEQAVQVMNGSRRQGDLQASGMERALMISRRLLSPGGSLSQERLAGGRLIS
jgi:hypothetical protein